MSESEPKVLSTSFPTIHMCRMDVADISSSQTTHAPSTRHLSAARSCTPPSTRPTILDTAIPIDKEAAHWTKRGIALMLLLSLKE